MFPSSALVVLLLLPTAQRQIDTQRRDTQLVLYYLHLSTWFINSDGQC